jgi:phenylacetic acid degradation operon negative regulatory protein
VQEKAARQALARLENRGWLERERHGRQTRWSLTPTATELLESGAERIYGFGQHRRDWDGRWIVLLTSVPETDRAMRYRMAQSLEWAGFGSNAAGTWISPWADREAHAAELLDELGVRATSFIAEIGALGSGPELAAAAWNLPALRLEYEQFLADTATLDAARLPPSRAAAELAGLVHRWRRFPFLDPDIPRELLEADWPGATAARRFTTLRDDLSPSARRWWLASETTADD